MASAPTVTPTTDTGLDLDEDMELFTVDEVAEKLRLKPWAVYKLCDSGELPSVYLGRKTRRIKPSDLRAFIESRPTTRPAAASAAS